MDLFITAARWITPLGHDIDAVFEAILAGAPAPVQELPGPPGHKPRFAATIPQKLLDSAAQHPRLRRAGKISLAAAAAADIPLPENTAVIFTTSNGGVTYTRRFYDQLLRTGAGSPLLFPETVYNAPASHIAALHGVTGITYTLVGDASVGLTALKLGVDLLLSAQADACIIAGAEEVDWVLCEAYGKWRLASSSTQVGSNHGALIAEGAAAILLSRAGQFRLQSITGGVPFFRQSEGSASLAAALRQLPPDIRPTRVISSANGTFVDHAERAAIEAAFGPLPTLFPKISLGDPFGASALMQIICATQSLRRDPGGPVLIPVIGLNHQAAAALVSTP